MRPTEPAFPFNEMIANPADGVGNPEYIQVSHLGVNIRTYVATKILAGMIAGWDQGWPEPSEQTISGRSVAEVAADNAVRYADALIVRLNKG